MFCYVANAIGLTWALNPTGIFLQHMHHYKHWQTSPAIDQSLKPTLTNLLFRILCLYIHYRYLMSNLLGNPMIQNSVWFTIGRSIQSEVKLNYNGCVTIIAALKRNWRGVYQLLIYFHCLLAERQTVGMWLTLKLRLIGWGPWTDGFQSNAPSLSVLLTNVSRFLSWSTSKEILYKTRSSSVSGREISH